MKEKELISKAMAILGSRTSPRKRKTSTANIKKARAVRMKKLDAKKEKA